MRQGAWHPNGLKRLFILSALGLWAFVAQSAVMQPRADRQIKPLHHDLLDDGGWQNASCVPAAGCRLNAQGSAFQMRLVCLGFLGAVSTSCD